MTLDFTAAAVPAELTSHYRSNGYQSDLIIPALLRRNLNEFGPLPALIDHDRRLTWGELVHAAFRFAGYLASRGVQRGDVVTWQLPNWWEAIVVAYGVWALGAVNNPLVEISREHELRQVLAQVQPTCVVTAAEFRGCGHTELFADVCRDLGHSAKAQVVVRGSAPGWTAFEDAMRAQPFSVADVDPDDAALVFMTSGTTSGAKAVVHSTRTYLSYPLRTCRWVGVGWADRTLSAFTLGHIGGLTWAVAVPLFTGGSAIITDRWDAGFAVSAIQHQGVTYAGGTALFAREMLDVLSQTGTAQLPLARGFTCGASPFTTALSEAVERAGLGANRAYGMSECPTVSGSAKFDTLEVRLGSDGRIAPGCEIRVVGDDGRGLPPGEVGEFVVRGPHRALGYLDGRQTRESFDADGWFRTGDLGTLSSDDVVTVTGRLKDIINRGGEKFSSREVEDLLSLHPAVFESAVVPAPHERYGEQPAAFVLLRQGQSAEPPELSAFLRSKGLATQKIPQVWRYVSELPRTPAGKVKKYELQAALATNTDQPA